MQTLLQLLASDPRVSFTPQPVVPSGDMRSSWRIALLLIILHRCHGKSATVEQLHAFGWAILAEPERETLVAGLAGKIQPEGIVIRFDPAWSRVMDLSVGFGLTEWSTTNRLQLTIRGKEVAQMLWDSPDVLNDEKSFLASQPRLSQSMVARLLGGSF